MEVEENLYNKMEVEENLYNKMEVEEKQSNLNVYNLEFYLENQKKFTQQLTSYENKFKEYRQNYHNLQFLEELQTLTHTQQQFLLEQQHLDWDPLLTKQIQQLIQQPIQQLQQQLQHFLERQNDLLQRQGGSLQKIQQELLKPPHNEQATEVQDLIKILSDQQKFISEQQQFIRVNQGSVVEQINKTNCSDCENGYVIISKDVYNEYIKRHQDPTYPTCIPLKTILIPNNVNYVIESGNNGYEWSNSNQLQDLQSKNKALESENQRIQSNYQRLQSDYQRLQPDYQRLQSDHQRLQSDHQRLQFDHQRLQSDYQRLESAYTNNQKTNYQKTNSQSAMNDLLKKFKLKDDHINDLKKANDDLRKEAKKYQLALGYATGSHLESQDSDSAGQLSKDIRTLHNRLDKFCGLKRGIEIKESEVKELLERYGCQLIGEIRNNKNLISGLLERHVIETIINKSNEYFKENNEDDEQDNDQRLEAKIVNRTEQLLELVNLVPENRTGTDEVCKVTSTKLRQQIYGVLGNRGFCNIKGDKKHQLIIKLRTEIVELMNRYRTFKDRKKLLENEDMVEEIVRQVINIFLFRLKVQEPVANWKFFENKTRINTLMMEASLDSSEIENLYVDVCSFPIIGSNLCEAEEETKNLQIIFLAQIIPTNPILNE
ncbi:16639_t:CDS:1 [Cetraspora pellucida]|uniref:16639_t:CDS:1 n=1 Tax=Cetraspora pellucida TaxID=1433469 RepID=A0A9N9J370_9GLOM|nr:16639_t:CDS:1 [Cetraspora pellucida]